MTVKRGEIYFVDLNPVKGREQAGSRPVLILSVDDINRRPLVVTVVVGTKSSNLPVDYPTIARVTADESRLPEDTAFLGFQIRSLDPRRFSARAAGRLSSAAMERVEAVVKYCLGL